MSFEELGLQPELVRAVTAKGYTAPTPIQAKAIPAVLSGRDLVAGAQTGTGKTAGFVLPLLQMLGSARGKRPRALVLTPTRELAAQIADSVHDYGANKNLRAQVIFGGVGEKKQIDGLRSGCDILVATPGRLLDLCGQGVCHLGDVRHFVLDEADRMLDMGFIPAIKRVVALLPAERQSLLFSATYTDDIRRLAERLLKNPVSVEVAARNSTAERVEQMAFRVPKEQKRHLLVHLFDHGVADEGPWTQVLVFTRTKHGANRLTRQLEVARIPAAAIHGNKSQSARVKALADFKAGRITALVATEVASRGLDIKELPHVVNYELPNVPEDYVHRIGRTARAGSTGAAVSLVAPDEATLLKDIERTMRQRVPFLPTPAFAVTNSDSAPEESTVAAPGGAGGRDAHGARNAHRTRTSHARGNPGHASQGSGGRRRRGGGRAGSQGGTAATGRAGSGRQRRRFS